MKLIDMKLSEYLDILKSKTPAPGGGSVSALAGAQAVGLLLMVAELTIGKEKYVDHQETCKTAKEKGNKLINELVEAIDKDTDAYNQVSAAFKMPKETEEEKEIRKKAISDATLTATEIPYGVMETAYQAIELTETMVGKSNPNAASDLGVAALNLLATVQGAWLNVKINLPGLKDETKTKAFREGGEKICKEAETKALEIYSQVLNQM